MAERRAARARSAACAWICAGALLVVPAVARADANADEAAQLFRAASAAFQRGELRAAAIGFEEANRRVPHGATLYNAAAAWEAAGDLPRAADACEAALRVPGLQGREREDAERRLAALEAQLGTVRVEGPPELSVTLAHVERARPPVVVHVRPGEQRAVVEHPGGKREERVLRIAAGESTVLALRISSSEPQPPQASLGPPVAAAPRRDAGTGHAQRILGWSSLGTAAAAFGVGVALGVRALEQRDAYDAAGRYDRDLYDEVDRLRIAANVCWAGAGVLAIAGVVLLVTAPDTATPSSAVRLTPESVTWRF